MKENADMKKSKLISLIILVFSIAMMISPAYAKNEKDGYSVNNTYIQQVSAKFSTSGSSATCGGGCVAFGYTVSVTVSLQRKNGTSWVTDKTWQPETGSSSVSVSKDCTLSSGNTYRVKVVGKAISSSGEVLEQITKYSGEKSN